MADDTPKPLSAKELAQYQELHERAKAAQLLQYGSLESFINGFEKQLEEARVQISDKEDIQVIDQWLRSSKNYIVFLRRKMDQLRPTVAPPPPAPGIAQVDG